MATRRWRPDTRLAGCQLGDQTNAYLFVYSTTEDYSSGCYNNDPEVYGLT